MNSLICPEDGKPLVSLYVNANQANKYNIPWNTNLVRCVVCKKVFTVTEVDPVVLSQSFFKIKNRKKKEESS